MSCNFMSCIFMSGIFMSCIFKLCTYVLHIWSVIFTSCNFMPCKYRENWSVNFMSCNFMSCNFDGPSFTCPAFSVNPTIRITIRIRESVPDQHPDSGSGKNSCSAEVCALWVLLVITFTKRYCDWSCLLISAPRLGVYYCQQVILSVCPSVCVTPLQIASSFLFLDGIEPFLAVISPWPPLQNAILRFLI